ncbi:Mu transposase C-terminal domain-containing protein [Cupriavidus necator]|uniref:Mu transposase C-terminal domain-containing protein n=1 Tax=Cupriavidus necator TaxID=106590 RepID=UPI0027887789|nr:Mu transposase C-terminal domain-containing protein [Cupriavidus necator]MDQ0138954.1 putative transposase [Cupriavidus necator]
MRGFTLRKGAVLERNQVQVKIVRIVEDGSIVLEDLQTGYVYTCRKDDLLDEYLAGTLSACGPSAAKLPYPIFGRPLEELPDHVKSEAYRRKRYLDYLADAGRVPWTRAEMESLIQAAATTFSDNKPPTVSSLYRWHRRFRLTQDVRSLVPLYHRRGPAKPNTNPEVIALLVQAIKQAEKTMQRWTMVDVESTLRVLMDRENYGRPAQLQLKMPTRRTLYRLVPRLAEYGLESIEAGGGMGGCKVKLTSQTVKSKAVLERAEIDHTPMDVFVVDDKTFLPLGRPLMTMVIDHYSRMPMGYYLRFGGPSISAVLGALRHAILPKRAAENLIPGLTVEHRWHCYGLMHRLIVDNGMEFRSDALERACFELGIELAFCPVRQPRFKGTIERFLKTLNYGFAHCLPGTSLAHVAERGEYDPLKHAILTLGELKHALEKWLLDIYAQTPHRSLNDTPYRTWETSAALEPPRLPQSAIDLMPALGIPTTRRIRHDAIGLVGLRYSTEALKQLMRRYGEGISVRLVYDPEDLGKVIVWPPEGNTPLVVPAVLSEYANGLTVAQHRLIRALAKDRRMNEQDESSLLYAKAVLANRIQDLLRSRKLRTRKKAARIQGANSEHPTRNLDRQGVVAKSSSLQIAEVSASLALSEVKPFPKMRLP